MPELLYELRDNVAHLTLNRPEAANAINYGLAAALEEASIRCMEDPNVRAVLLTGAGKLFCGGGDLKSFAAQPPEELAGHLRKLTMYLHTAIQRFARMKAPLIIAVNGNAGGAGLSLALIGDLVLAGESSRFTVAYTRIGLSPDGSSSYYLPRVVGLKRAMELMLTNRMITAREAEAMGIVTRVVADAELLKEAEGLARELAQGPTLAYGGVKRLLYASLNNPLYEQMDLETEIISELSHTEDARAGIAAFLAKQAAKFSGR
jgi:2-(1,2-epoxy-1,2-dihydrophenyl)acetyl-CoA isomerase